ALVAAFLAAGFALVAAFLAAGFALVAAFLAAGFALVAAFLAAGFALVAAFLAAGFALVVGFFFAAVFAEAADLLAPALAFVFVRPTSLTACRAVYQELVAVATAGPASAAEGDPDGGLERRTLRRGGGRFLPWR
ncbi:MAG: hypothetical protein AAGN82_28320, partial [Myxococcota bacterium]